MNRNNAVELDSIDLEELLSSTHISRAGQVFRPTDDHWKLSYSDQSHARLSKVEQIFAEAQRPYFRLALARYASVNSADSIINVITFLSMLHNDYPDLGDILDPIQFISLKARRGKSREYQLATIRGFFRYWHNSELWGVSDEFISATSHVVFSGNEKGRAVKEKCPFTGPYTPIEMQGIITGINNAFANRELEITPYLATLLMAQRAVRRAQAVQLVFGDFKQHGGKFSVRMPRAKQRGAEYREAFTDFEISEDLYNATMLQRQHVIDQLSVFHSDIESVSDCLPVFPRFGALERKTVHSKDDITPSHHITRERFSDLLDVTEKAINVHSERTGMPLHLTSSRFRRSLGTDLAREGHGVSVIATALDHNDHQNCGVYTETSAEFATRLDMRIGKVLAPMAQAFAGVIIRSEKCALRGNDPASRVRSQDGEENIGNCGEMGFCGAHAPIACYTCKKFQPWLDAPHEEVLLQLYEEREEFLAITGDETMAGILDRQILAVEDVINRCAEMKLGMDKGNDHG